MRQFQEVSVVIGFVEEIPHSELVGVFFFTSLEIPEELQRPSLHMGCVCVGGEHMTD